MIKHLIKYLIFFLLVPSTLFSQLFQQDYSTRIDSLPKEKTMFIHLLGASFFNNNEFFNAYQPGYTLIGGMLQPKLIYVINSKLKLSGGLHLREYYGDDGTMLVHPLFSIDYKVNDAFNILMGSFEGGQNHRLPETIFAFENHFSELVENGILININKSFLMSEIWLDWEKFIKPADTFREEFMVGIVNRIKLFTSNENLRLEIPVIILAHHAGGQINNNNQAIESVYNISEGFKIFRPTVSGSRLVSPATEVLIHHSAGDYATGSGTAIHINAGIGIENFELNAGYFIAKNFMSFRGLPLYHSFIENQPSGYTLGGTNEILNFKAGFRAKINRTSFLFLRFEGYYNLSNKKFDYTYGLHMQVNEIIRFKK